MRIDSGEGGRFHVPQESFHETEEVEAKSDRENGRGGIRCPAPPPQQPYICAKLPGSELEACGVHAKLRPPKAGREHAQRSRVSKDLKGRLG